MDTPPSRKRLGLNWVLLSRTADKVLVARLMGVWVTAVVEVKKSARRLIELMLVDGILCEILK